MKYLELNGVKIRVTKYKITIFENKNSEVGVDQAETIANYLRSEGFIEKDEIPVEIIRPD